MSSDKPTLPRMAVRAGLALCLMVFQVYGYCGDDLLTSQLVDEARSWQTKGRSDLASNAWRRILVTNPQHTEALASLGIIEAQAGRMEEAQSLYQRAKRTNKASPRLNRLAELLSVPALSSTPAQPTSTPNTPEKARVKSASKPSTPIATPPPVTGAPQRAPASQPSSAGAAPLLEPRRELVVPPTAEVRVTPLQLPQITPSQALGSKNSEEMDDVRLRTSETIKTAVIATASLPSPAGARSNDLRRAKPCKLPLGTPPTTTTN